MPTESCGSIRIDPATRVVRSAMELAIVHRARDRGERPDLPAHPGAHVAVVSHKATIRLLISSLLGFDPRSYRDRLDQSPASAM